MISVTELRKGTVFAEGETPFLVLDYHHTKVGRGTANIKVKVRNLKTGAIVEKTFISGARVGEAEVVRKKGQYLYYRAERDNGDRKAGSYPDSGKVYFMDPKSFEQFSIPVSVAEGVKKFLPEGSEATILFYQNKPLAVELPLKIDLKVTETGPSEKGDTRSAATKEAVLETGYKLQVPMFVKVGDVVRVNTETGKYVERLQLR